ncbi:trypsin-like peptidase domain-containing protein [Rhodocyclaceae bacterium SMB388]
MRQLWLVFAQTVTVAVAALFVVTTLKPDWIGTRSFPMQPATVTIVQAPERLTVAAAPGSYAEAAGRSMHAVVHIFTSRDTLTAGPPLRDDPLSRHFFGDRDEGGQQAPSGRGSGVIVSPDGLVLTNNHVIDAADGIEIALNDGRKYPARLIGRDPETDLAVLRLQGAAELPFITFSSPESLQVGDVVLAIGNPFGVGQTVTMGIVSALGRTRLGISTFENYIQTDAAINPGNSGGALVDANGNLVGINTAIYSSTGGSLGIGFAIPVSLASKVLEQIVASGEVTRGWVGVEIQEITRDLALSFGLKNTAGALISGVLRGSPAEKAGIRPGDIVVELDGRAVIGAREMLEMVAELAPGQRTPFKLRRSGGEVEVAVGIGRRPTPSANRRP